MYGIGSIAANIMPLITIYKGSGNKLGMANNLLSDGFFGGAELTVTLYAL
ncbi:hypothetical protein GCM10027347_01790 [Larkinella harenae]